MDWKYESWAEAARAQVARAYLTILRQLAEGLLPHDPRGAAERYLALVALDPLCEEWHRGVMSAHAAAGEPAPALRQFHECRAQLRQEQGVEPGEETHRLYTAILRGHDG